MKKYEGIATCAVCGFTDVVAYGYCVHCGTPFEFEDEKEKEPMTEYQPIRVVLSAVLPLVGGSVTYKLTKEQAEKWIKKGPFTNYVQHDTVRAIGVAPAATRETCETYDQALVIKPRGRLDRREQGEYTLQEIEAVGYDIYLVIRFDSFTWGYEGYCAPTDVVPLHWGSSAVADLDCGPGSKTLDQYLNS